jgi:quercetin dioxygenase-like cupin family protein
VHVVNLNEVGSVDPSPVLAGPWRWIRLVTLAPGGAEQLESGAVEYAVFIVGGGGTASIEGEEVRLTRGVALTLMRGAGGALQAGGEGLKAFLVAVDA